MINFRDIKLLRSFLYTGLTSIERAVPSPALNTGNWPVPEDFWLPDGVMVAQLVLVQFVRVQVLVGQPFFLGMINPNENREAFYRQRTYRAGEGDFRVSGSSVGALRAYAIPGW